VVSMAWSVCSLTELPECGAREFTMGDGDWPVRGFVIRYQEQVRAFLNKCPHAGLPLNFKPDVFFAPDAPLLQCTVHGALFDPLTGECVQGPCVGRCLQPLPVTLSNGCVNVGDVQPDQS
jgi:nitrite reductase/ring-hydroxylating ferredoxin subunit